jgi:glycerol-3-phosphate acyltransferase PlsY
MIIISYILGSLNTSILLCKFINLPSPLNIGSHNPGFSNVFRSINKHIAYVIFMIDIIKTILILYIAYKLNYNYPKILFIGLSIIIGNTYSIFFNFQGGKGVSNIIGIMMFLNIYFGILSIIIWIIIAKKFHFAFIASLSTIILLPIYIKMFFINNNLLIMSILLVSIVYINHVNNLYRFINKKEYKI